MVKLNLAGLQSADSSSGWTQAWSQSFSWDDSNATQETNQDTTQQNDSNYSFSLSSLIWNNTENTKQENIQTTETTNTVATEPVQEVISQEVQTDSVISQPQTNNEESLIKIEQSENTTSDWEIVNSESTITESKVEQVEEESKEFFKNFDIIKEFREEKTDELIIWKWELKLEETPEWSTQEEELLLDNTPKVEDTILLISDDNQSILETSKETAEQVISEEVVVAAPVNTAPTEEVSIISESPVTQESSSIFVWEAVNSVLPNEEQLLVWENITSEVNQDQTIAQSDSKIENANKELSATRKPFWIKSFNKKSLIVSLWALFVFWVVAFWATQFDLIWWKTNLQEINTSSKPVPITPSKYVAWTDFTIIKNKRKNIKKSINPKSEITVWAINNETNSWILLDSSWTVNIESWSISQNQNSILNNSWTNTSQEQITNDEFGAQMQGEDNQTQIEMPVTPKSNDSQINDMNSIADWVN